MKVQKVSLEKIAKVAGVHKATVSRCLRNHPTISLETRERVQALAKRMGYRPNPLVSLYQSHARSGRPRHLHTALGWFNDYPTESCWRDFPWLRGYLEGALKRCESLGYRLEQVDAPTEGPFEARMRAVQERLATGGIYGVVLPLVINAQFLSVTWQNCVVAMIGGGHRDLPSEAQDFRELYYPHNYPSADRDLFYNTRLALKHMRALGYKRIGFIYSEYLDDEALGRARAGYLIEQELLPAEDRMPILFLDRFKEGRPLEFDAWFHQYGPDAILCVNPSVRSWAESMGLDVPRDLGLANLNLVDDVSDWSGIYENHPDIGAAAVDLIISSLTRNELGRPPESRKILVPGLWNAGSTLRKAHSDLPIPTS